MSRNSCLLCSSKHTSAAEVLAQEANLGYPLHAWLAVGHLEQAESELLSDYPVEAKYVREERVKYINSLDFFIGSDGSINLRDTTYKIDTMEILKHLTILLIELNSKQKRKRGPSK